MKQIKQISNGANFTAISLGNLAELSNYVLTLSPEIQIPGKVFLGGALATTGAELSFQSFAVGAETGFLHTHKNHEEVYIFLAGQGEFQVDGEIIPVCEGSVVRVAPNGKRSVRNVGDSELVMICIQYKADSFSEEDTADGNILSEEVKW
jgi:mannose-6-phosphate isomerase-like protein (cupin superfamily)